MSFADEIATQVRSRFIENAAEDVMGVLDNEEAVDLEESTTLEVAGQWISIKS